MGRAETPVVSVMVSSSSTVCVLCDTVDFVGALKTPVLLLYLDSDTTSVSVLNGTLLHRQPSAGFNLCILCIFHIHDKHMLIAGYS